MLVAQPEVSANGSKSALVLPPVAVERGQADLAPLDHRPAAAVGLHVTVDLERYKCILRCELMHLRKKKSVFSGAGCWTHAQLRCAQEVVLGQFVFAGDPVALAVEG